MALIRTLSPVFLTLAMVACSGGLAGFGAKKDEKSGAKAAATGTGSGSATSTSSSTSAAEEGGTDGGVALDNAGLPDGCTSKEDNGQWCVTCTPRDLPVTHCAENNKKGFDPKTMCSHDLDKIQCDLGGDPFVVDLQEKTKAEKLYDRVPLLVFGVKLLVGSKIEEPKKKEFIFKALDVLKENAKELFTCGDMTKAANELGTAAKAYNPDYDAEMIAGFKDQAKTAMGSFQQVCKSGKTDDAAVIGVASGMLGSLPDGIGGDFGDLDVGAITSILSSSGGSDGLASILQGGDLSSIIGQIGGSSSDDDKDEKTSTKTSTKTATSTSTGT